MYRLTWKTKFFAGNAIRFAEVGINHVISLKTSGEVTITSSHTGGWKFSKFTSFQEAAPLIKRLIDGLN